MAITLTDEQKAAVQPKRKPTRPTLYSPTGGGLVTISEDFEAWLILSSKSLKAKVIGWIKEVQKGETDDVYQNLLKECLDVEKDSLEIQDMDLSSATSAFTEWRSDPQVEGFENVQEVGWLFQELQQGLAPYQELAEITHHERLRQAVSDRYPMSEDSEATRKTRLNTWIAVLNAY